MKKKTESRTRDLDLLYEVGALRNMPRAWIQTLGGKPASVLEHTLRVMMLALLLARREGKGSEEKIMKMALLHDMAEGRTGDHNYNQAVYVTADEQRALQDMTKDTTFTDFQKLAKEYKARKTIEAQIVKDADNLDIDLEMKEYELQGHTLPGKWKDVRALVRKDKFYTKAACQIWDEIQTSDPSAWHLIDNKFYRFPNAGR